MASDSSASTGASGAPGEVLEVAERLRREVGACLVDAIEQIASEQTAHVAEPDAHRVRRRVGVPPGLRVPDRSGAGGARLERAVAARRVDARAEHLHAVTHRVAHDRVRRVEAHRLRVEQRARELGRVVQLHPRARVHEVGEAHRVALGEAEVGERLELVGDLLGRLAGDPPLGHPVHEPVAHRGHARLRALRAHRLAQLVGLAGAEARGVDRDLHELLLEQRHAERLLEAALEDRVRVGDRLLAVAPPQVRVHRAALDRAGADERDLDHEVVEGARAAAAAACAICARLSTWNTPMVSAAQSRS